MIITPHQAWAPRLARNYDERSRLFFWREMFTIATMLVMLALPTLLSATGEYDRSAQISMMGLILVVALPVTVFLSVWKVPDPMAGGVQPKTDFTLAAVKRALADKPVRRILLVEIAVGIAIAGTAGTFLFAAEWGFGVVGLAPLVLMLHFVAGFAAMPVWVWISKRTEKHLTMRSVCIWSAATFLLYIPLAAWGGPIALAIAALISGAGYGTPFFLTRSMMADVIELEEVRGGTNRSGMYYALMSGAYKTGAAFAIGIPYVLLEALVGFTAGSENSPETVRGLMIVFVAVPVVAYTLAALLIWRYPMTRAQQAQAAEALAQGGQNRPAALHVPLNDGDAT